jgi:hypothetical protein
MMTGREKGGKGLFLEEGNAMGRLEGVVVFCDFRGGRVSTVY